MWVAEVDRSAGTVTIGGLNLKIKIEKGASYEWASQELIPRLQALPQGIFRAGLLGLALNLQGTSQSMLGAQESPMEDATVTLELPEGTRVDTYYNYGPTPDNPTVHWYEFLYDGETGAEILEDQILLHFKDGQRGDHDLAVNGEIVTLGAPMLSGETLYFPYNHVAEGNFVGFAVSNISDEEAVLSFQAYDEEGFTPASLDQAEILSLLPGQQLAKLGTEIFSHQFDEMSEELIDSIAELGDMDPSDLSVEVEERSWVELTSSASEIGSFFQFGTNTLSQLDGSVAVTGQAKKLYFSRIFEGPVSYRGQPATTALSIANPNVETITLQLTLHPVSESIASMSGPSELSTSRTIPGKGFLIESVSDLFGEGTSVSGGYVEVEVTEGDGAVGFELIQLADQDTVIGLNASSGNESSEGFSAQLASLDVLYTNVNLINTSSSPREVILTAINEDGTELTDPVTITLDPGEQFSRDAGEIFAAAAQSLAQELAFFIGSLQAEMDGPGVLGDVIFGDRLNFEYAAALPLQGTTFTEAVFSQVANVPGFFTGLAFYNPGAAAAEIEIEVISATGESVGNATRQLPAGQRLSRLVDQLVTDSAGQAGGYVRIRSDQPIVAQLLFGTVKSGGQITLFSAVPPTVVQ
jgi:hypothetical protein